MAGLLAHGVHLLLVILGLIGVAVLLLPQLHATRSRRTPFRPPAGPEEHEQRIAALRSAVEDGRLTSDPDLTTSPTTPAARDASLWRAVAVSSSVAAAGIHAAVFPHHLDEAFLVGVFFLATTLAQAGWACLVCLEATRQLLLAGIVGNLALVALWGVSRSVGLPFLGRESVGGWDLAAGAFELILVAACVIGLRRSAARRALVVGDLGRVAWSWVALSGVALVVLTLTVPQH